MKVAFFSAKPYDRHFFDEANLSFNHEITYLEPHLDPHTAQLAESHQAVCAFVNDTIDAPTLRLLSDDGVRLVALRCAGYNNVDLEAAKNRNIL
ncbi:2-hydroxyacid dehydrogenase, partial [bacterium]|nr:2-hydroxyacid dehydrogenase [bacterium]